jgi:hypothetical protein
MPSCGRFTGGASDHALPIDYYFMQVATFVALKYPRAGLGICICCLIAYLKPDPPGVRKKISQR